MKLSDLAVPVLNLIRRICRAATYRLSSKLTLVYITTVLLTAVTCITSIRAILPEHPRNQLSERLSVHIFQSLPEDATDAQLRTLADELGAGLMVTGPDGVEFTTDAAFPDPSVLAQYIADFGAQRNFLEFSLEGQIYIVVLIEDRAYVMSDFVSSLSTYGRMRVFLGGALILIGLGLSLWAVRKVVRPIHPMTHFVQRIGQGDFPPKLECRRSDELGTLERHINEMAHNLETSSKSKRDLLVALGHEFSSPIARVFFQVERIEDEELRRKIHKNLMRINSLLKSLISVEMLDERNALPQVSEIPYPEFLEEFIENEDSGMLELAAEGRAANVHLDVMSFKIMLSNFIENARKYAPGSKIRIETNLSADILSLAIKDRGPGIAPEAIKSMTEPFTREDQARGFTAEGMGLGLYICSRIVAASKGTLKIHNRNGGGLCIKVKLPVS